MTGEANMALIEYLFALVMGILYISSSMKKGSRSNFYFSRVILSAFMVLVLDASCYMLVGHGNMRPIMMVLWIFNYAYSMIIIMFFHMYINAYAEEYLDVKVRSYIGIYIAFFLIAMALWIISAFNGMFYSFDEELHYIYTNHHIWSQVFVVAFVVPDVIFLILKSRQLTYRRVVIWLSYVFIPVLTRIVDLAEGYPLIYTAFAFSVLICYVMINQDMELKLNEQRVSLAQKSLELQEMNQKIMTSQIQPHFLYNVLNTICFLCRKDPEAAARTTSDFASYLRTNLNALSQEEPVAFDEELEHVETYLRLEQQRFGDDLKVEYDIRVRNFFIPVLSLQPIVENAVKHGICQDLDGGTLKISTRDDGGVYTVVIEDDGVGFDVNQAFNDGKTHVGIENTRRRIRSMSHGDIRVESAVGVGTKVTITLPKASNTSFYARMK